MSIRRPFGSWAPATVPCRAAPTTVWANWTGSISTSSSWDSKPLDEAQWAAGYKVDLLFGPDAVTYQGTFGSGGSIGSGADDLGCRMRALLCAPLGNGLDLKIGAFESPSVTRHLMR